MKIKKESIILEGKIRATLRNIKTGKIIFRTKWNHNVIPTVGLTAILRRLSNSALKTNEGIITYGAVGSGSSTPAIGDTLMLSELGRAPIATVLVAVTTLTIETFFNSIEGNGTITQFALFGEEATTFADTGTMFEYANFNIPFVKTTNQTLTVECILIIS